MHGPVELSPRERSALDPRSSSILMSESTPPARSEERPPQGLRPRWILDELRRDEIQAAIHRFAQAGLAIPQAWTEELSEIEGRLSPRP